MKIRRIIYYTLALPAALIFMSGCTEETSEEEIAFQEKRFFDLYLAANYPDAESRPSGLYYLEHNEGAGRAAGQEDWVLVNHVGYTIPEDEIFETYIENVAIDILDWDATAMYGPYKMYNGLNVAGLKEGLSMMREGGQATFLFTSELGHGSSSSSVGAYKSLKYEIELLEVIGGLDNIDAYEQRKISIYLDTVAQYDTVYDAESEKAISYIVDFPTDGPLVDLDSTISLAYKGYLMDGRVFDEKTAEDPFIFKPSNVEWAARWDLVLSRLHEGEKVRLIFPYQLAYGEEGEYSSTGKVKIPPFETLLFDLEIISVEASLEDDAGGTEK